VGELFWTQDAVAGAMNGPSHYSKEEIYSAVQPFNVVPIRSLELSVGSLGIERREDKLIFTQPKLRKMQLIDFLEKAKLGLSLGQLKKRLINEGLVFTPADFRVLREIFFRGYKNTFVLNVGYVAHCHSLGVVQTVGASGESDLPYMRVARFGECVVAPASQFWSPFKGYKISQYPLSLQDLMELPDSVHYSDLADLSARTRKLYDETSIGALLSLVGKQLLGARPWRLPTVDKMRELLKEERSLPEMSRMLNIPVPYLVQFLEQHLDLFEFTLMGKVTTKTLVNRVEGT